MLFSKIFTGLALLSASATTLASPTPVDFAKIEKTSLTRRAVPLVQVPVCVSVDLENQLDLEVVIGNLGTLVQTLVRTATIGIDLDTVALGLGTACLCLQGDVINPNNVLTVQSQLISGTGVLGEALRTVLDLGVNPLVDALTPVLNGLLIRRRKSLADSCPAGPTGSVPRPVAAGQCQPDGEDCPIFDCPANLPQNCPVRNECIAAGADCCPDGQYLCGTTCIVIGQGCQSGVPQRKRSVKERSRYACRQPLSACPVSHFLARDGSSVAGAGFECLDTLANIESCGGCISPFKGNVAGQDCTAIANADDVACADGTCIVGSCVAGFVPSADGSTCVASSSGARFSTQGRQ